VSSASWNIAKFFYAAQDKLSKNTDF